MSLALETSGAFLCSFLGGEDMQRATMSVAEFAKWIGISRSLAYQLVKTGKIPAIRLSGRWLIPIADAEALLKRERID